MPPPSSSLPPAATRRRHFVALSRRDLLPRLQRYAADAG